jgi:osmotically-inducible protein OsmY
MSNKIRNFIFLCALITISASVIFHPARTMAASDKQTDRAIRAVLEKRLQSHDILKNKNIQVSVANDTITLSGIVPTIADKMKAEEDAKRIGEDYTIVNNISIRQLNLTADQLLNKVVDKIHNNVFYSIFDWVTIDAENDTITLNGWVYDSWHRSLFEHQIEKVPGVIKINNDIQILPVSIYDDQIRSRAASLIYDNRYFEPYSNILNPPIHIIVDRGVVTLEGYVTTRGQKSMAETLIDVDTGALKIVNNLYVQK